VLKKVLAKTHSCHRVTARPVALKDANPFIRTLAQLNGIAGADSGDEDDSWCFVCDCGSFLHNGNLCSHIGACAHTVGAVDLDVLITQLGKAAGAPTIEPRRAPRPGETRRRQQVPLGEVVLRAH
jgi:hypothetical protein